MVYHIYFRPRSAVVLGNSYARINIGRGVRAVAVTDVGTHQNIAVGESNHRRNTEKRASGNSAFIRLTDALRTESGNGKPEYKIQSKNRAYKLFEFQKIHPFYFAFILRDYRKSDLTVLAHRISIKQLFGIFRILEFPIFNSVYNRFNR